MNKTLVALMNKLSWQLNEVEQLSQAINEEQKSMQQSLHHLQQQIHQACATSALIIPEQEIARLNFIIQKQQRLEELSIENKAIETRLSQLNERKIRLQTELKMLEKYQGKLRKESLKKEIISQQNANDEWILQRKEPA
ncbi:hypothetical protein [Legionella maceachernii]|uniref:Flagellar FliJ protein n=1 Tax=Legionella maceachernii TaxID=466 RepID=A0A0W0W0K9_9GAMM|nr:hypothetical protein [Legionella maceachernii]KTD25834.1 hypothetical protein Lmac_1605 [Legionella maceachernii]SJZ46574.1 hypothetical protein SAMN02745128_00109 [Legionella maceachernii]SUP03987.1 Uncharacterised protein [Legionella maceachernii]